MQLRVQEKLGFFVLDLLFARDTLETREENFTVAAQIDACYK